jgi:hypothetical protein
MDALKGIFLAAKTIVYVRCTDETPVEPVGPTVVTTLDSSGKMSCRAGADPGTAMPAHIEKPPQRAIPVASNDDALPRDLAQKVIARRRDLVGASGADPGLAVEAFQLVAEEIRICVIARG